LLFQNQKMPLANMHATCTAIWTKASTCIILLLLSIKTSNRAHNTYILLVLHSTNVVKWMLYAINIWNKILKIFKRRCNWLENVNTNLFLYV
jgi:hypothetical protein